MSLLCLTHVTKSYPSQALPAVDDLSLELESEKHSQRLIEMFKKKGIEFKVVS